MATGISCSTTERSNFARLCRLLIDGGTRVLRGVFDTIHPPSSLHSILHSPTVHSALKSLKGKRVLTAQQWQQLYPSSSSGVSSSGFDITLLFLLLRNISNLTPPVTGWDKLPGASDITREADLVRVKFYRNNIFAHISGTSISNDDFETYWKEIENVLVRLGGSRYEAEVQRLKVASMDGADEAFYIRILKEWEDSEKNLKAFIKETENRMTEKLEQQHEKMVEKLDKAERRITHTLDEVKEVLKITVDADGPSQSSEEEVSPSVTHVTHYNITVKDNAQVVAGNQASSFSYVGCSSPRSEPKIHDNYVLKIEEKSRHLKTTTRWHTELQLKPVAFRMMSSIRTDDIFTSLVIQYGRKPLKDEKGDDPRNEQLDWYGKVSGIPVERCQDIFIGTKPGTLYPKTILIIGKPGIGKSLLCRKLIRDWALDRLFEELGFQVPIFKFAFLLTFRQLRYHEDESFDLLELLNLSSLLEECSAVDSELFDYMLRNKSEVLIIIDGYDEYSRRNEITDKSEERYPNDPRVKMPVSAMCSKLMKGKILRGAVVLITSRPAEADELGDIDFDEYVEITGFSSQQVRKYIEKYFKSDEATKNIVLEHIMSNENLVSFGHIPVLCFLMCWYMDWQIQSNSNFQHFPVTVTDLCSEVTQVFVQKHHSQLKGRHASPEDRRMSSTELLGSSLLQIFHKRRHSHSQENLETADVSPFSDKVLDKISKLAAKLLIEKKLSFGIEEMESFGLTRQEIENLKASGLLQCGPSFRISAFEVAHNFCFTHLILHEYLAALWFVKEGKMPTKDMATGMVCQFMAGVISMGKDRKLLERLVNWIKTLPTLRKDEKQLLTAKCLYEYKDREFAKIIVENHYERYCDEGNIAFLGITDVDCIMISFLLDIFSSLNEIQKKSRKFLTLSRRRPLIVKSLYIGMSTLSLAGFKRISDSLSREFSSVTEIEIFDCGLSDECASGLEELLVKSNITYLDMNVNKLSDKTAAYLCNSLKDKSCKLAKLYLSYNEINDKGAELLCKSLLDENCKLTKLVMYQNNVTDECRKSLKALVKKHKPDFDLRL